MGSRQTVIRSVIATNSAAVFQKAPYAPPAGSRLAGICHPGGVPLPVTVRSKANSGWLRAELWPDAVLSVEGQAKGPVSVRVIRIRVWVP